MQSSARKLIALLLFSVLLLLPTAARAEGPDELIVNYLSATPDNQGRVTVSAYVSITAAGQPVTSLGAEKFSVVENGQAITPGSVVLAGEPMSLILVLDTSGSMKSAMDAVKVAARTFIETMAEEDRLAVFSFNEKINLEQDLSVNHGQAINIINGLSSKDKSATCLYDAAIKAIAKAAEVPPGRRAIVLLTDGNDDTMAGNPCSTHTFNDVVDEATTKSSKVPLFTIGLGKADKQELGRLASLTGGHSLMAGTDPAQLTGLFKTLAAQLKGQYRVTFTSQSSCSQDAVVVIKTGDLFDEGRVFIPCPPPLPTATPAPVVCPSLEISGTQTDKPFPGNLEVTVKMNQLAHPVRAGLYVDEKLKEEKTLQPPVDTFILNLADFAPGEYILRVEAPAENNCDLAHERYFTADPPPPTPTPAPPKSLWQENMGPLTLIGLGLGLLAAAIGVGGYWYWRLQTKKVESARSNANPNLIKTQGLNPGGFIPPREARSDDPGDLTVDEHQLARLVVIEGGQNIKRGDIYPLKKNSVIIGRNAPGQMFDVNIPEKSVSRPHFQVTLNKGKATIQDLGSTNGTFVNDQALAQEQICDLPGQAVIRLGEVIQLRFEFNPGPADPTKTIDEFKR